MKYRYLVFGLLFFQSVFAHTGKVVKKFNAPGKFSTGMTFDGKHLWVADYKAANLFCVDPQDGSVVRSIPSPGYWPSGLAWDGAYLWNLDTKQKKIFKLSPKDGEVLFTIDAPGRSPEGLTWKDNTLWVTDTRSRKLIQLDISDGTDVLSYDTPADGTQGLTFDGKYFWCSDRLRDEIYMIDPERGEVIIIADAPGPYPRGMAWDGKYLWVVDYETDEIYQLVREDEELYRIRDTKQRKVTYTHEAHVQGNGKLINMDVYLAIPANSPSQKINTISYNVEPVEIVTDRWDQQYAHINYSNVEASAQLVTTMTMDVELSTMDYFIFPDKCGTLADIPKDIRAKYTVDDTKYDMANPYIQNLSKKLAGDEKNPYWIARKMFDHVRNTLEYELTGGWNAAPVVLQRGTGSCSEYSFSFIALCRAAGVPARYVGADVVRGDDASLDQDAHRWPEIYLPNYGWIPIDPQGGDRPVPRDRAYRIGHLDNRLLVTTKCGGNSNYMGWYYNSNSFYQTDPQLDVTIDNYAEWEPIQ